MNNETSNKINTQFTTWRVSVSPKNNPNNLEQHYPPAKTEEEARMKALKQAQENGMKKPHVCRVDGPYNPDSYKLESKTESEDYE